MDVPEKLYFFFEDEPVLSARSKKLEGADIEYTRTDAFIEKAAEWIKTKQKDTLSIHLYVAILTTNGLLRTLKTI